MKALKTLLPYIYITAGLLFIFWLIGNKAERIQRNLETSLSDQSAKYYDMSKSEFKDLESVLMDSLYLKIKDSLNLKIKHIERTIKHEYYHVFDSSQTLLITHENSPYLYFSKDFDNCLHIDGRVKDTVIYWDKPIIDYKAQTVYYWERKYKVLGFGFGRKIYKGITLNKCSGESYTEEIKINKK